LEQPEYDFPERIIASFKKAKLSRNKIEKGKNQYISLFAHKLRLIRFAESNFLMLIIVLVSSLVFVADEIRKFVKSKVKK